MTIFTSAHISSTLEPPGVMGSYANGMTLALKIWGFTISDRQTDGKGTMVILVSIRHDQSSQDHNQTGQDHDQTS